MTRGLSPLTLRITCPLCHGYGDTTTATSRRPMPCSTCSGSGHVYVRPAPGTPTPREQRPSFVQRGNPYFDTPTTRPTDGSPSRRTAENTGGDGPEAARLNRLDKMPSTRARARELPLDRIERRLKRTRRGPDVE